MISDIFIFIPTELVSILVQLLLPSYQRTNGLNKMEVTSHIKVLAGMMALHKIIRASLLLSYCSVILDMHPTHLWYKIDYLAPASTSKFQPAGRGEGEREENFPSF